MVLAGIVASLVPCHTSTRFSQSDHSQELLDDNERTNSPRTIQTELQAGLSNSKPTEPTTPHQKDHQPIDSASVQSIIHEDDIVGQVKKKHEDMPDLAMKIVSPTDVSDLIRPTDLNSQMVYPKRLTTVSPDFLMELIRRMSSTLTRSVNRTSKMTHPLLACQLLRTHCETEGQNEAS